MNMINNLEEARWMANSGCGQECPKSLTLVASSPPAEKIANFDERTIERANLRASSNTWKREHPAPDYGFRKAQIVCEHAVG